jgi:nicotinamidase/pyrazinamidase
MQRYHGDTALIIVDVQNDFADPAGGLSVPEGAAVIPVINGEIAMATSAQAFVAATQDWHPESTPHFAKDGGIWPVHCVADTWGAELHPDLALPGDPSTGETVPTELEAMLRDRAIARVVVVGLATDYCVKATALDAKRLGFDTFVLADAIAAVDIEPGDGARALDEMRQAGIVLWQSRMR